MGVWILKFACTLLILPSLSYVCYRNLLHCIQLLKEILDLFSQEQLGL